MAARKNRIYQTQATRDKIKAALIAKRMFDCLMGEVVLDAQQVSCAKALLNKVLPDLQNVALTGEDNKGPAKLEICWLPLTN